MPAVLPHPIDAYVQAQNTHDTDALLTCFADDALVHDEGRDIRGAAAIRAWSDDVNARYRVTLDVVDIVESVDETVLAAQVSGTFDGSPVLLHFHFTLAGEKIAALRIQ
jgi:ketosteroid isomerase-like protein